MSTVVLIDYGSGNLRSAEKALARAAADKGCEVVVSAEPDVVASADRLVLPGVGAFAACMGLLYAKDGLIGAMTEAVKDKGVPFMGICVGMQLLGDRGLEFGVTPGLGWISGDVKKIERTSPELKVPHMGWNSLSKPREHPITSSIPEGGHVYFTHSFILDAKDPSDVIAWTDHGGKFVAAVARDNVAGMQFHPEKSQALGIKLLGDFLEWRP
jgi:imidazole glycerol-phosphate synthase subunit HisH